MIITLQKSPLSSAEMTMSPEIPAIWMFVPEFPKKHVTREPGGTFGKINVMMLRDKKDAVKTIKPNILSSFWLTRFSVCETGIII